MNPRKINSSQHNILTNLKWAKHGAMLGGGIGLGGGAVLGALLGGTVIKDKETLAFAAIVSTIGAGVGGIGGASVDLLTSTELHNGISTASKKLYNQLHSLTANNPKLVKTSVLGATVIGLGFASTRFFCEKKLGSANELSSSPSQQSKNTPGSK